MTPDERFDREEFIIMRRENGDSFRAIGSELGICGSRVRDIFRIAKERRKAIDNGWSYLAATVGSRWARYDRNVGLVAREKR